SFNVTVQDTTAPSLTLPANVTVEATGPGGTMVSYAAATTSDVVDGNPQITYSQASGTQFPLGVTTVTVSAHDSSGNTSSGTFQVSVVDTTAPVITAPASITVEATGPGGASVAYAATASDVVDGS